MKVYIDVWFWTEKYFLWWVLPERSVQCSVLPSTALLSDRWANSVLLWSVFQEPAWERKHQKALAKQSRGCQCGGVNELVSTVLVEIVSQPHTGNATSHSLIQFPYGQRSAWCIYEPQPCGLLVLSDPTGLAGLTTEHEKLRATCRCLCNTGSFPYRW